MDGTFFDAHDELYHHAKFGEDRATRAGRRCENVVFVFLPAGLPRSGKLSVLNLLTGQKSGFSPRRGVAPIHVKLGMADGHVGTLGCAKFHLNRHRGGNAAPKMSKISTFKK